MISSKHRNNFIDTEEGQDIKRRLQSMSESTTYNTTSTYSSNSAIYPDNLIPFVDKHLNYLMKHPLVDANQYLANIRMMTLVK